ncbi:MAG: S-methyl-5'-thioadenosine phosphorylase [Chloroflexota bacterium]|nr:MAG: S-methyl-5'-thioadenosine phosphorylase [Chloroflexota bacterium]
MAEVKIGIIGGSGLYDMEGLTDVDHIHMQTPFGSPSDAITVGTLDGIPVAFLPRHGRGHYLTPTEIPAQANIYALKSLGVEWIISVSAVGSLREHFAPQHIVIPDQLIDRTKSRINSFFGDGVVAHVTFADPFCPVLSDILHQSAEQAGATVHKGGTYVVMEGPLFSTKAESHMYRSWGASIIGMTALPEAKLAREAEIHYATLASVTDYDCWHESEEAVTIEMVIANLEKNVEVSKRTVRIAAAKIAAMQPGCGCGTALQTAIITAPAKISADARERLGLLIGKYIE